MEQVIRVGIKKWKQQRTFSPTWLSPNMSFKRYRLRNHDDKSTKDGNCDYLSKLPLEIQRIVYDYVIGYAIGKVSYVPRIRNEYLEIHQEDTTELHTELTDSALVKSTYAVRYHLPFSATPGVLLVCRSMYESAVSQYHKICTTTIETTPKHFHNLPSLGIVPGLRYEDVEEGFIHLGTSEYENPADFDSITFLQRAHGPSYPNLKALVFVVDVPLNQFIVVEPCFTAQARAFQCWWRVQVIPQHFYKPVQVCFETRGTVLQERTVPTTSRSIKSTSEQMKVQTVCREEIVKEFFQGELSLKFLCRWTRKWYSEGNRWRSAGGSIVDAPYRYIKAR